MKTIYVLSSLLSLMLAPTQTVMADSGPRVPKPVIEPHPCTPTVQAQPSYLHCSQGSGKKQVSYSIEIDTLMSPAIPLCSGKNYYEYRTAKVEVWKKAPSGKGGQSIGKLEIYNGHFTYQLGLGDGRFESEDLSIELTNCTSPLHGGMSIGN